ncbi:hypothetical protein BB561_005286 [Smittium simulii]|uniref:EF-hand domain-containing protein n=1 Tax=Smittium simulii TaxID=133385 RepID=A0A2T9YB63_9FUNG|nr:hypothetical protein BB561_005286 [Smittium simulii]
MSGDEHLHKELEAAFHKIDTDNDGMLSSADLHKLFHNFGHDIPAARINAIIQKLGGAEGVSLDQIKALVLPKGAYDREEEYKGAFAMFDVDGDKLLCIEDLKKVLASFGEDIPVPEIEEMIKEADVDGDGKINYEEFVKMLETM